MKYNLKMIAERRKRMGYNQTQFASGICTASQYSQFERGLVGINPVKLTKLLERLNLTIEEVLLPEEQSKVWKRPKSFDRKELKMIADDVLQAIETCKSFNEIGRITVEVFRKWDMVPDDLYEKISKTDSTE